MKKNDKKYDCPVCMGSKKHFTGKKYKDCTTCDEKGKVNEEVYDLFCGEEDTI